MAALNWTPAKSTMLSIVVTWIALTGTLVVALLGAIIVRPGVLVTIAPNLDYSVEFPADWQLRAPLIYLCLATGAAALVILLRLLYAIRRGDVFVAANVARLRWISYCGFVIALICLGYGVVAGDVWTWIIVGGIAVVAAFLALIMRVVKNVIAAACLLQEDSDYTI